MGSTCRSTVPSLRTAPVSEERSTSSEIDGLDPTIKEIQICCSPTPMIGVADRVSAWRPSERQPPEGLSTHESQETSARRSVSRVLSRPPRGGAGMAIHLGPPVARRLMRPTRGLGSAPLPRRRLPVRGLRPPIWPCSGWSLPVSLRSPACAVDRHRHCGTGPRLTADGRYPPPCAAELGLSSRPDGSPRRRRATIRPPR